MDDLAPAPAQRTSEDGGRALEQNLPARKKAVKRVQALPAPEPDPEPDLAPDAELDHQLDVLG